MREPLGFEGSLEESGGPGRGRSHRAAGMEKRNHQSPMPKSTMRREKLSEKWEFCSATIMAIDTHCRKRPAQ